VPKYEPWMSHKRVEGTGPLDARILLVGEAPGVSEVQYGAPFVGGVGAAIVWGWGREGVGRGGGARSLDVQDRERVRVLPTQLCRGFVEQRHLATMDGGPP
jgi:hypothetical protein